MDYAFEKRLGVRRILNTEWPVDAVVYKVLGGWISAVRCNMVCERSLKHRTKRAAVERAKGLTPVLFAPNFREGE